MKNNHNPPPTKIQKTNVVYEFRCPLHQHGHVESYIGHTSTTLSRRLTMHNQSGSILNHFQAHHKIRPTRTQLTENTEIIATGKTKHILAIKEALLILQHNPKINKQYEKFNNVLQLHPTSHHAEQSNQRSTPT